MEEKEMKIEKVTGVIQKYSLSSYPFLAKKIVEKLSDLEKENRLKLKDILEKSGIECKLGRFSDDSASWIDIIIGKDDMVEIKLTISFDGRGNKIQDITAWVIEYEKVHKKSGKMFRINGNGGNDGRIYPIQKVLRKFPMKKLNMMDKKLKVVWTYTTYQPNETHLSRLNLT